MIKTMWQPLWLTYRIVQAKRMVREADVNGDGKISKEEFLDLLHQTSVPDSLDQYDSRLEKPVNPH